MANRMLKNEIEKVLEKYTLYLEIKYRQIISISTADEVKFPHRDYFDKEETLIHILELVEDEIDWDMIKKDIASMVDVNIHGHINSPKKWERKPVVSRVGEECSKKIAKGIVAYLKCVITPESGD